MVYNCDFCSYSTADRSNYSKHKKTKRHVENVLLKVDKDNNLSRGRLGDTRYMPSTAKMARNASAKYCESKKLSEKFICENCDKTFTLKSSLARHIKRGRCKGKNKIRNLETELDECKDQLTSQKMEFLIKENKELKEYINSNKGAPMYNISVKNYIQNQFPDAPPLLCLPHYRHPLNEFLLEHHAHLLNNEKNEDKFDDDLVNATFFHQNHKTLHKYFGDFLLSHYKKDNPAEQSIWNTDTSRLTFIIKELIGKNSFWNRDVDGVKTRLFIIDPLLKYVDERLKNFIEKNKGRTDETAKGMKLREKILVINAVRSLISDKKLSKKISKYIAPHLRQNQLNGRRLESSKVSDLSENHTSDVERDISEETGDEKEDEDDDKDDYNYYDDDEEIDDESDDEDRLIEELIQSLDEKVDNNQSELKNVLSSIGDVEKEAFKMFVTKILPIISKRKEKKEIKDEDSQKSDERDIFIPCQRQRVVRHVISVGNSSEDNVYFKDILKSLHSSENYVNDDSDSDDDNNEDEMSANDTRQ